jgi:hypothetical protein
MQLILFRSPYSLLQTSPELFIGELTTYLTFFFGYLHAKKNGNEHLLFLLLSCAAASFVDPICLIHPQIRNYFHSHASILMIDSIVAPWQFPLFANIAYVPGAIVWCLNLKSLVAETALVAVVASWTFYGFDLVACRWLLYQWHQGDPLYQERTQCVPLGSSMWVMTYACTASLLARVAGKLIKRYQLVYDNWIWWSMFFTMTLVFLPLHIIPITLTYFPLWYFYRQDWLAVWGFWLVCVFIGLGMSNFLQNRDLKKPKDKALYFAILQSIVWFGGITSVGLFIDPGNVISTSRHEPYGGKGGSTSPLCSINETYLFGMSTRPKYICEQNLKWWTVVPNPTTGQMPKPGDEFYTIRGLPQTPEFSRHFFGSVLIGVLMHVGCVVLSNRTVGNKIE